MTASPLDCTLCRQENCGPDHQKILRSRKLARHCALLSLCHPCHRHLALHDRP